MSNRNIHSLSLTFLPTVIETSPYLAPALSDKHSACSKSEDSILPTTQMKTANNTPELSWIQRNPSTILRQGLATPSTPCFSLDEPLEELMEEFPGTATTMDSPNLSAVPAQLPTPTSNPPLSPDEVEWLGRYVPLCNLPTPSVSDSCDSDQLNDDSFYGLLDSSFYGPAQHVASMIPRKASRASPDSQLLHLILQRANIGLQTTALACCILDCLTPRFLRSWRLECQNEEGCPERCEVLAVTALCIAMKFVEDSSYCARLWASNVAERLFSTKSLCTTERLILADINYGLLGISSPDLIEWNLAEMRQYSTASELQKQLSQPVTQEISVT